MNNLVPSPQGIDVPISLLQSWLYSRLYVMWGESGLTSSTFQMWGRVYRNNDGDNEYVPQAYLASKEYAQDMFYDDKLAALMWFGLNDPNVTKGIATTYNISLYVFVNLALIESGANIQRKDELVINEVRNLILPNRYGFYVKNIVRDIDNVLNKFKGSKKDLALRSSNMQSQLCFRLDMTNTIDSQAYVNCGVLPLPIPTNFSGMTGTITVIFKDDPNTSITQTLVNGTKIQLYYPTGASVTIPHLIGRYVFPILSMDGNTMSTVIGAVNYLQYTPSTGTFNYGTDAETGFQNNSVLVITYNENN